MASLISSTKTAGFITYAQAVADYAAGDAKNGVVWADPLTSLPANAVKVGVDQAAKDAITFTADGLQFQPTFIQNKYQGVNIAPCWPAAGLATTKAKLSRGGTIYFEATIDFFDGLTNTGGTSGYVFYEGNFAHYKGNSQSSSAAALQFANPAYTALYPGVLPLGKSTYTPVMISWNGFGIDYYVWRDLGNGNGAWMLMGHATWTSGIRPVLSFASFYLGGQGTFAGGGYGYRIKNFFISTLPVVIPVRQKLQELATLGHSFCASGGYYGVVGSAASYYKKLASTGDGGASAELGTSYGIHRVFLKRGFNMAGQLWNYGLGGSAASDVAATQVPALIAARRNVQYVLINTGINNIASNTGAITTSNGDATDWKNAFIALIAGYPNIKRVDIATIATGKMTTDRSNAACTASIDALNAFINALPAWEFATYGTNRIRILDQFGFYGGHSFISGYFAQSTGTDPHPNSLGYDAWGNYVGEKILEDLANW